MIKIEITGDSAAEVIREMAIFTGQPVLVTWKDVTDGMEATSPETSSPAQSDTEVKSRRGRPKKTETETPAAAETAVAEDTAKPEPATAPATSPEAPPAAAPVDDWKALQNECRVLARDITHNRIMDAGAVADIIRECGALKIGDLDAAGLSKLKLKLTRVKGG